MVYPVGMDQHLPFDLPEFMLSHFNRVDFGGNLFEQWPAGIRFEIGISQVSRATKLYEFLFAEATQCILVSQDWVTDRGLARRTRLFRTPGIFLSEPFHFDPPKSRPSVRRLID